LITAFVDFDYVGQKIKQAFAAISEWVKKATNAVKDFLGISRSVGETWDDKIRVAVDMDRKAIEHLTEKYKQQGDTAEEASLKAAKAVKRVIEKTYEHQKAKRQLSDEEKKIFEERIAEADRLIAALDRQTTKVEQTKEEVQSFADVATQDVDDNIFASLLADAGSLADGVEGVIEDITSDYADLNEVIAATPTGLIAELRDQIRNLDEQKQVAKTEEEIAALNEQLSVLQERLKGLENLGLEKPLSKTVNLTNELSNALSNMTATAITAFAEVAGAGMKGMSAIGHMLSGVINIAENLGKMAIGIGVAALGINAALKSLNPIAAIAGGTALVALAQVAKGAMANMVPGMKEGGIVPAGFPNDTYLARLSSGERVVPPHKLDQIGGGGVHVEVTVKGETRGDKLLYMLEKVTTNRKRVLGR
jgi:hypothetical protein